MRVVILGLYPVNEERIVGGVEAVVSYLSEELRAYQDLELHIVTCLPSIRWETIGRRDGLTIHLLPGSRRFGAITRGWADVRRIVKKIREIDPDVVHAHGITAQADGALRSGYPTVITVHGIIAKDMRIEPGIKNRFRAILAERYSTNIVRRASHVIAISPYVLEEYGDLLRSRVYMLENPIHRKFYEIESRPVPNRLLFAGRIIQRKCVLELLQSVKEIRDSVPDVELRIAGDADADSSYLRSLLDYIRDNHLQDNVRFLGFLPERAVLDEYASCSLVVLTSKQETSPMAIQQAMAAGRAVVSTNICGVPYLVEHGKTGLLVQVGDVSGFARAVVSLLQDDAAREEMGRHGRIVAQRFRADEIARKHLEVYQGMLNASGENVVQIACSA